MGAPPLSELSAGRPPSCSESEGAGAPARLAFPFLDNVSLRTRATLSPAIRSYDGQAIEDASRAVTEAIAARKQSVELRAALREASENCMQDPATEELWSGRKVQVAEELDKESTVASIAAHQMLVERVKREEAQRLTVSHIKTEEALRARHVEELSLTRHKADIEKSRAVAAAVVGILCHDGCP